MQSVSNFTNGLPEGWLGLATNHRRLLNASQDGWLRPFGGADILLGKESFVAEAAVSANRNDIPFLIAFDPRRLPFFQARKETPTVEVRDSAPPSTIVRWPAPLSLHATVKVAVPCAENRSRLQAMADQLANVSLPGCGIDLGNSPVVPAPAWRPETPTQVPALDLPDSLDAVQGAIAMATWAVPRIDPWIDVLVSALRQDAGDVSAGMGKLGSPWFRLPWLRDEGASADEQMSLWRAALSAMRCPAANGMSPSELAGTIAEDAGRCGATGAIDAWLHQTQRIAAADETISWTNWHERGAGLAIQLALLRPKPTSFCTWSKDLPSLPPPVWWAAAALCGWRHGYRGLDKRFRGSAALQECLAVQALEASWRGAPNVLPALRHSLEEKREHGCFSLDWGGVPVFRKQWHPRAKWYHTNLACPANERAAEELARSLGWPCLRRCVRLHEGRTKTHGEGNLSIDGTDLVVRGDSVDIELASNSAITDRLNHDEFRRHLATEAGDVSDPPQGAQRPTQAKAEVPSQDAKPHGLHYRPDFITEEEEERLIACIEASEWSPQLQRRVQHYGWRYDYRKRQIDESMRLDALPVWADELAQRLVDEGLWEHAQGPPDQLIVNEYVGKQGIAAHCDHKGFDEPVATLSLIETWGMVFRHKKRKFEQPLERRSVAVLTGEARYKWSHEIPKRKNEGTGKGRLARKRRVSLTFRRVRRKEGLPPCADRVPAN